MTYATVRSRAHAAHTLPNIRHVDHREQVAIAARRPHLNGDTTIAVSMGLPSMDPDVWRKDVRRAKDKLGAGQILIVSVVGTADPGGEAESLIADYAQCAEWAADAGADAVEVHLAVPTTFGEPGQMVYENIRLSAQILYAIRTSIDVPIVAKLGIFRTPRILHETATKLSPWASGFALVSGIPRRVVDEEGNAVFEGAGREWAEVVGSATFPAACRQIEEMLAWRKAGAYDHAVLAMGGLSSVARARHVLLEGANAALVATTALFDPLFAVRFRAAIASAA
ncbi:MAG: hypothetical protein HY216_16040 [Candidatus Rokubacteria bacterium]|nr:hypothetical protein [Candidatus Rokubacteria bacterium]